ncbi:MAG: hypothetical protein Q9183_007899, partial [Haloplaca sp. 2 TL-2023]
MSAYFSPFFTPILFILILFLISPSFQVSVTLSGVRWLFADENGNNEVWTAGCTDLQPGECCMKPPGLALDPGFVIFQGLQDFDIAFLWKTKILSEPGTFPANALEACSGEVERSHVGGGGGSGGVGVESDAKAATAVAGPGTWVYRWGTTWPDGHEAKGNPQASGANYL